MLRITLYPFLCLTLTLAACGTSDGEGDSSRITSDSTAVSQTGAAVATLNSNGVPDTSDLGMPTVQIQEKGKVYPVDEGPQNASFVTFRQHLIAAVQRKDAAALEKIIADDIRFSFGVDAGRDAFIKQWKLDQNQVPAEFWNYLSDVIQGGGVWQTGVAGKPLFSAPYYTATYSGENAFTEAIITGQGVNVRSAPSTNGRIIGQLSHDVVPMPQGITTDGAKLTLGGRAYGWTAVQLPGGQTGFVVDKFIGKPAGYRASFEQVDGQWRMLSFISGD